MTDATTSGAQTKQNLSKMSDIIVERKVLRSFVTKTITELDACIESRNVATSSQAFSKLEGKVQRLLTVDEEIIKSHLSSQGDKKTMSPELELVLEKEYEQAENYRDKFICAKTRYLEFVKSNNSQSQENASAKCADFLNLNLPKLELTEFDGNPKNWFSFWSMFQKIDADLNLEDDVKFAYLLQTTKVTPFDVVKTRLQVQAKFQHTDKICSVYETCIEDIPKLTRSNINCCGVYREPLKGTLDALLKISKTEGVKALWSGLVPTLLISVPSTVIYFTMYDQLREAFTSHLVPPMGPISVPLFSGILARVLTGTIVSPIEFFRTKIQSEHMKYSDAFKSITKLVKHKGYLYLWHGWVPTMLRDVPFSAIYWTIYEQLKVLKGDPSAVEFFVFGAVSGSIAAILTLPFDVIKTHRQAELGENKLITRVTEPSVLNLLLNLYHKGGMKSLFAGMMPRVLKIAPACAIMISSYEVGKIYFGERRRPMSSKEDLILN